jgi:hypothetical protein
MRSADAKLGLLPLLCLLACAPDPKPAPKPLAEPSHHLGESFPVASAICTLASAESTLTEPRLRPIGRPPEDIGVVEVRLDCRPVTASSLPLRLRWLDDARREHVPSTRTALSEREPDLTVFEVALREAGTSAARRYDAKTGDPRGRRERRKARLLVDDVVIAPWPRHHDAALDDFLDRLARTLASGAPFDTLSDSEEGHAAIRATAELYQRVIAQADQLVVRTLALPMISLALEQGGGAELAQFQFELDLAHGEPRVLRAVGVDGTRNAVQCAEDARNLAARIEPVKPGQTYCNVLGSLVPGSCQDVEPSLLRDALRFGSQCELPPALGLDPHARQAPPDFELRLRRGRTFARLERAPHYAASVMRSGKVVFDGQQRVKALGTHEGRTSPQMLAALADRFARLGWFERQDGQGCRAADDRGDLLELRMNGRTRALRDREGCRGGFTAKELELARNAIERALGIRAWLEDASPDTPQAASPRDTQIWMVAAE